MSSLLAQLLLVSGYLVQARSRYEELLKESPGDPNLRAALGTIALRQGNREEALKQWGQALINGVTDPELCFRYAVLAEDAGIGIPHVIAAVQRAIQLAPDFDDARYKLALLENNSGNYRLAVEQLRAMRIPVGARVYGYWTALASALTELNQRDEAETAAQEAIKSAHTDSELQQARQLAYVAMTDLTVQFTTDSEGRSQMVTTRVQHGTTDWNPFIEPSDRIQHAEGKLTEVVCSGGKLSGFVVRVANGLVGVDVPDPMHVLIRNGPKEFFCGRMPEKAVQADYAVLVGAGKTRNLLRGLTFQ
jgi:tetratricopeptide (TPR) repeat protein